MFSASLFVDLSAYGFAFVSATSSVNSLSSSISLSPVISNFSLFTTNFSGLNSGVVGGGVTLLLNSLSSAPVAFPPSEAKVVTVVNTCPDLDTFTVMLAFIVS